MGTVNISRKRKRRIRPGASCADVPRNISNTRNRMKAIVKCNHVDGHMDKYLLLTQMNLEQQMNYVCNKQANKAANKSIEQKFLVEEKQLFPEKIRQCLPETKSSQTI